MELLQGSAPVAINLYIEDADDRQTAQVQKEFISASPSPRSPFSPRRHLPPSFYRRFYLCRRSDLLSPLSCSGLAVSNVYVDGKPVGWMNSFNFTDVRENHTISVDFAESPVKDKNSAATAERPAQTDGKE